MTECMACDALRREVAALRERETQRDRDVAELAEVVGNSVSHLSGAQASAQTGTPWWIYALGITAGAGALAWALGAFDGGTEAEPNMGSSRARSSGSGATGAFIGKLVDRVAGRVLDRAIAKVF